MNERRKQEMMEAQIEAEPPVDERPGKSKRKAVRPKRASVPGRETRDVTPRHEAH